MSELDCTEVIAMMGSFLDRELDATEREAVETHLGQCSWCAGAFRWEGSILRLVKDAVHTDVPEGLLERLVDGCDQE